MGTLLVQGESAAKLYWNNPEKTAATMLGDDWLNTGDMYYRDEDGYFINCGRGDDMIKVGGLWCSPFEIEARLIEHPKVLEAAVVGRPDDDGLIKPEANIVLNDSGDAGAALGGRAENPLPGSPRPIQIPALVQLRRHAAQDRDRQDPALPAAGGVSCAPRRRYRAQGSRTGTSVASKSRRLRVTSVRPCRRAIAAIWASTAGRGRPVRSPSAMISPHIAPASRSNGRIRPSNCRARSCRIQRS